MNKQQHYLKSAAAIFQTPLCSAIPEHQRADFLDDIRLTFKQYDKGEVIITEGALYESLHIIVEGEVSGEMSDEKGDFMRVERIKAPNPIATGLLFVADNRLPVSVICRTATSVLLIPKDNVLFLMKRYEPFMLAFLSNISTKVVLLFDKLRLLSLRTIRAKLAYYLLKESAGERVFHLKISREEIARLFSVSRPALIKILMDMKEKGIIDVHRKEVVIIDRAALQNLL